MADKPKIELSKNGSKIISDRTNDSKKRGRTKFDGRLFHQNAGHRQIRSLTQFKCPVCECENTVRVDVEKKKGVAWVRCTYCGSLPEEEKQRLSIPYPYRAVFLPGSNKADCFFQFSTEYDKLKKAAEERERENEEGETTTTTNATATAAGSSNNNHNPNNSLFGDLLGNLGAVQNHSSAKAGLLPSLSDEDDDNDSDVGNNSEEKKVKLEEKNESGGEGDNEEEEAKEMEEEGDVEDALAFFNDD